MRALGVVQGRRAAATLCAAALLAATAGAASPAGEPPCRTVAAGASLQAAVDAAPEGAALCLAPGVHAGPVRVTRRLALSGPREAVIASRGHGTTVSLEADGAVLEGVRVDGSGGRFDLLDAAVRVHADDVRVEGVRVTNALFGLLVEQSRRVVLRGNEIAGDPAKSLGMRGDGIRLWEVRESLVADNRVADSRDIVVWYAPGNRIVGNRVERGRYGTHLMYSHDNAVEHNRYIENVVGIFVMYSRGVRVRHNWLARAEGAAGMGLGAKESGNLLLEENQVVANHVGIYLDTSPLQESDRNQIERNVFRLCDAAVVFHGVTARNRFQENRFRDNGFPVRVEGGGDAREAIWRRNEWGDYAGYDLDGDGVGDVPYELRSLENDLVTRLPTLAFFRGSPAMGLVELIGRVVPLFRPQTLLVDPEPLLESPAPEILARAD